MSRLNHPATLNCIVCGKPAIGHSGHVIAKQRMALGNYIDVKIGAGWCDDHTKVIDNICYHLNNNGEIYEGDANGCYGKYDIEAMGIRELFTR